MAVLTALAPQRDSFVAPITLSGTVKIRKSCYATAPERFKPWSNETQADTPNEKPELVEGLANGLLESLAA